MTLPKELGLLFSPGAGSFQSLHCNPTSGTFLGQGGRWGRGGRCCSLLREVRLKPVLSVSLGQQSPDLQHSCAVWPFPASLHTLPTTNPWICTRSSLAQPPPFLHTSHSHPHPGILALLHKRPEEGRAHRWSCTRISNEWGYMEYVKQTGEVNACGASWGNWGLRLRAEWVDKEAGEWIELHTKQLGMRWKCWMPQVGVKGKQTRCLCNNMQIYIFYAK